METTETIRTDCTENAFGIHDDTCQVCQDEDCDGCMSTSGTTILRCEDCGGTHEEDY